MLKDWVEPGQEFKARRHRGMSHLNSCPELLKNLKKKNLPYYEVYLKSNRLFPFTCRLREIWVASHPQISRRWYFLPFFSSHAEQPSETGNYSKSTIEGKNSLFSVWKEILNRLSFWTNILDKYCNERQRSENSSFVLHHLLLYS